MKQGSKEVSARAPVSLFLDTRQAAQYLDLQPATLEAWRCRGGGPIYLKLGRSVKYRLSDLDAWVHSRLRENTNQSTEC